MLRGSHLKRQHMQRRGLEVRPHLSKVLLCSRASSSTSILPPESWYNEVVSKKIASSNANTTSWGWKGTKKAEPTMPTYRQFSQLVETLTHLASTIEPLPESSAPNILNQFSSPQLTFMAQVLLKRALKVSTERKDVASSERLKSSIQSCAFHLMSKAADPSSMLISSTSLTKTTISKGGGESTGEAAVKEAQFKMAQMMYYNRTGPNVPAATLLTHSAIPISILKPWRLRIAETHRVSPASLILGLEPSTVESLTKSTRPPVLLLDKEVQGMGRDWIHHIAVTNEHAQALYMIGLEKLATGTNGKEYEEGLGLLERASSAGSAKASLQLAQLYQKGFPPADDGAKSLIPIIAKDLEKARIHAIRAAQGDIAEGFFLLGTLLSGSPSNATASATESSSGDISRTGRSTKPSLAFQCFDRAAQMGLSVAQYNVGNAYFKGQEGMEVCEAKALEYWEMAAHQYFPLACANLAAFYVERDKALYCVPSSCASPVSLLKKEALQDAKEEERTVRTRMDGLEKAKRYLDRLEGGHRLVLAGSSGMTSDEGSAMHDRHGKAMREYVNEALLSATTSGMHRRRLSSG